MKLTKYHYHVLTVKDLFWMMEFIRLLIFIKIVIIKKDYDHRKILWSWKNIAIMEKYCDDWNLSNTHEVIKTVLNFSLQKYFTHIKSIKTLNKQLLLRYFLYAQKCVKHIKYKSSIVNEVIRGNFTSIKRIRKIRVIV